MFEIHASIMLQDHLSKRQKYDYIYSRYPNPIIKIGDASSPCPSKYPTDLYPSSITAETGSNVPAKS